MRYWGPSHHSSHGSQIMYGARGASGTRCAQLSGLDYHERADRQKRFDLVDRAVVDRDASGGPVDVAGVENRLVGAMDSDPVARGNRVATEARHFALRDEL